VAVLLIGWSLRIPSWTLIVFELGAIATLLLAAPVLDRELGRWSRGAEGEETVGRILEELSSEGWHVLHDVSFGRGNIDHAVVGPGGVFAIETKSHPGRRSVDRIDPKMLAQAYAEKKTLETVTGIEVQPLLVFSRAYLIERMPAKRQGVTILPARMLVHYFSRRRPALSAEQAWQVHSRLALAVGQAAAAVPA
jgi:hypothetical protein